MDNNHPALADVSGGTAAIGTGTGEDATTTMTTTTMIEGEDSETKDGMEDRLHQAIAVDIPPTMSTLVIMAKDVVLTMEMTCVTASVRACQGRSRRPSPHPTYLTILADLELVDMDTGMDGHSLNPTGGTIGRTSRPNCAQETHMTATALGMGMGAETTEGARTTETATVTHQRATTARTSLPVTPTLAVDREVVIRNDRGLPARNRQSCRLLISARTLVAAVIMAVEVRMGFKGCLACIRVQGLHQVVVPVVAAGMDMEGGNIRPVRTTARTTTIQMTIRIIPTAVVEHEVVMQNDRGLRARSHRSSRLLISAGTLAAVTVVVEVVVRMEFKGCLVCMRVPGPHQVVATDMDPREASIQLVSTPPASRVMDTRAASIPKSTSNTRLKKKRNQASLAVSSPALQRLIRAPTLPLVGRGVKEHTYTRELTQANSWPPIVHCCPVYAGVARRRAYRFRLFRIAACPWWTPQYGVGRDEIPGS
jgi:hypothetical protein